MLEAKDLAQGHSPAHLPNIKLLAGSTIMYAVTQSRSWMMEPPSDCLKFAQVL